MDFISAAAIGCALAADAAAVSISCGAVSKGKNLKPAFISAITFGIFQMLMPIFGWSIGEVGKSIVGSCDNFLAFAILLFLGAKMIYDAAKNSDEDFCVNGFKLKSIIYMAFATSIDALASGIILPSAVKANKPVEMFAAVLIIGVITFCFSLAGFFLGKSFSFLSPKTARSLGGAVLILIAIKTLLEL